MSQSIVKLLDASLQQYKLHVDATPLHYHVSESDGTTKAIDTKIGHLTTFFRPGQLSVPALTWVDIPESQVHVKELAKYLFNTCTDADLQY